MAQRGPLSEARQSVGHGPTPEPRRGAAQQQAGSLCAPWHHVADVVERVA
eukprot:CAMPEP_0174866878 /NCGR_PEP_ID=MMETSP1114-20130205/62915_1 /TAXON_ID=312471 /ORGANISM="Neobodo designis, Strain CCAP 1951/1" /LENGTH=49 /DNA_ID= /DNA_START= /DNA_END= /DNA_ORIENTATION=